MRFAARIIALGCLLLSWNLARAEEAEQTAGSAEVEAPVRLARLFEDVEKLGISKAELISSLNRANDVDNRIVEEIRKELDAPESEYEKARRAFEQIDAEQHAVQDQIDELNKAGKAGEAEDRGDELADLSERHGLARKRFDLAIERRDALRRKLAILEEKAALNRESLDILSGSTALPLPEMAELARGANPASVAPRQASETKPAAAPAEPPKPASPADEAIKAISGGLPILPGTATPKAEEPAAPESDIRADLEEDPEVKKAQKALQEKRSELDAAQETVKRVERALAISDANIKEEEILKRNAAASLELANRTVEVLNAQLERLKEAGQRQVVQADLSRQIEEARLRAKDAQAERTYRESLEKDLVESRQRIEALRKTAAARIAGATTALGQAEQAYRRTVSPFSLPNLTRWFGGHGIRVALIVIGMLTLRMIGKLMGRRLIRLMSHSGDLSRGSLAEREDRARTLVGVFNHTAWWVIVAVGSALIMEEFGAPIAPLLGGAAVFGLAAAFGAQNLVRDFFYGLVILFENQYKLNDVVRIGSISGQVERITLRTTQLRDIDGNVHFIPNGEIKLVTNMTHGWSRAVFEIGVSYREDVDRVMQVLLDLGREIRKDPEFGPLILEDMNMMGVDSFGESSVNLKFFMKTRPLQQWTIKREMLRRIKNRFDALGIEIPYPQRTVHHVHERVGSNGSAAEYMRAGEE